jgi:hypothetical protein
MKIIEINCRTPLEKYQIKKPASEEVKTGPFFIRCGFFFFPRKYYEKDALTNDKIQYIYSLKKQAIY